MSDATTPAPQAADIRVLSSGATDEEIAAVTAVVTASLEELAAALEVEGGARVSAWQRTQRNIRTPLHPGPGAWRGFSG